jgi:hypothetical protein
LTAAKPAAAPAPPRLAIDGWRTVAASSRQTVSSSAGPWTHSAWLEITQVPVAKP